MFEGYESVPNNCRRGKEGLVVAARSGTFVSMERMSGNYQNILSVQTLKVDDSGV